MQSTNIRAIAQMFRLAGWISFWIQLVLGVISGIIVLLYAFFSQRPGSPNNNPGRDLAYFWPYVD